MHTTLKKFFGYDSFRTGQEEVIESVLSGQDVVVLMPTGGGKSLCFQIPALNFTYMTLVVSPLISLMKDQVDTLKENGIEAEFLNSSLGLDEQKEIERRVLNGEVKLLYVSPERVATSGFRTFLKNAEISLIAIDEAHCISQWGHDFRPDYTNLSLLREWFPETPIVALTATATQQVKEDIIGQLSMNDPKVFVSSFFRSNLNLMVEEKTDTFSKIVHLVEEYKDQPTIIYVHSRKDTEKLAEQLTAAGYKASAYHAGLSVKKRQQVQDRFIRDRVSIIVATIAFGMGIDKPDVRLVIHHTLPKSMESYYQEVGRAGRDGLPSTCVLFYSFGDIQKHEFFIRRIEDRDEQASSRRKLQDMVDTIEQFGCRWKTLVEYFGETWELQSCQSCDRCLGYTKMQDGTEIVQKILSAVLKTGSRFGRMHVIRVLLGSKVQKIKEMGHDKLSVYGIVDDFSQAQLVSIFSYLTEKGILLKEGDEYPIVKVSEEGKKMLVDRETFEIPKVRIIKKKKASSKKVGAHMDYNEELFEKLRQKRTELASKKRVPPFVIFGDKALYHMASALPKTREDFLEITGVGNAKLRKFGKIFLEIIAEYV